MGYWLEIAKRARKEALSELRWTSPLKVAQSVVPTAASGLVMLWATGQPAWGALASVGALLTVGVAWFLQRLLQLPATIHQEQQDKIAAIEAERAAAAAACENVERQRRRCVMDQLVNLYMDSHDGISPAMRSGFELPPEEWLNEKLTEIGEPWSVFRAGEPVSTSP